MKKVKGFSLILTIVIIGVVAVGVVIIAYFLGNGGLGFGGGNGDNEGSGNAEAVQVDAKMQTTETTTEAITTQEIIYVEVTVSENKYIFNNVSYEIDDIDSLISDINKAAEEKFTVRITDEYASSKAYEKLKSALNNEKIRFIEIS